MEKQDLTSFGLALIKSVESDSLQNIISDSINLFKLFKNIKNYVQTVQDEITSAKIIKFLNEIETLSDEERKDTVEKLVSSKGGVEHVGMLLLDILNKTDDYQKPILIGKLFKSCASNQIKPQDFFRFSTIINNMFIDDILKLENIYKPDPFDDTLKQKLLANGLMHIEIVRIFDPTKALRSLNDLFDQTTQDTVELRYTINSDCKTLAKILFNADRRCA